MYAICPLAVHVRVMHLAMATGAVLHQHERDPFAIASTMTLVQKKTTQYKQRAAYKCATKRQRKPQEKQKQKQNKITKTKSGETA
jgi:hypothetical protein